MLNSVLLYIGAGLAAAWGIAHLVPTRSVVRGFGELSGDNKNIITMEWIVEGVSLIFIGGLVAVVTFIDPATAVSRAAYATTAIALVSLAIVSVFTGFRVAFLPFKLCPAILTLSAVLIIMGSLA